MISVIIPSFNSAAYVAEALASILPQLDSNDEVIFQDGGSTDETIDIVSRTSNSDPRLKLFLEKDSGQSDALNRALRRATKDYIMWLNADDVVLPGAITSLKVAVKEKKGQVDFVYGSHRIIDGSGGLISHHRASPLEKRSLLLRGCYIFSGSFIVRRSVLESIGGFAEDYHYCMDLDLLLRIVELPGLKSEKISAAVGALRWHDASKSGGQAKMFVAEGWKVRQRFTSSIAEALLSVLAAVIQSLAIGTTPLRHSKLYQLLRGRAVG